MASVNSRASVSATLDRISSIGDDVSRILNKGGRFGDISNSANSHLQFNMSAMNRRAKIIRSLGDQER